jgi:hypothetical protein
MNTAGPRGLHARLTFAFDGDETACKRAIEQALGVSLSPAGSDSSGQAYLKAIALGLEIHLGLPDADHAGSLSALSVNAVRVVSPRFEDVTWHFAAILSGIDGVDEIAPVA